MNSINAIALSGLNAAQLRLGTAAHNVANAQTPGFRRQQVSQQAQPGGGVQASLTSAGAGDPTAGLAADLSSDLAADLVGQRAAFYDFKANLAALRAGDDMLGSLLDVKA